MANDWCICGKIKPWVKWMNVYLNLRPYTPEWHVNNCKQFHHILNFLQSYLFMFKVYINADLRKVCVALSPLWTGVKLFSCVNLSWYPPALGGSRVAVLTSGPVLVPNDPPTSSIHFLSAGLSSNATPTLHPTIYFQYLKDRVENNISFVSISVMKPTAQSGETKEKPAVHYFRGRCEFDCFHTGIRAQNTVRDRVVMKSFAGGMHRQTALKIMSQGTSDEGTGCLLPGCFSRHAHLNNLPCWACAVLPGESRGTGGFQKGRCCFFSSSILRLSQRERKKG